jgi:hypothetical protein
MKLKLISLLILLVSSPAFALTSAFKLVSKKNPTQQMPFAVLEKEVRTQYSDQKLFDYLSTSDLKLGLKPTSVVYTSQDGNTKVFVASKTNERGREEAILIMFDLDPGNSNWRVPAGMKMLTTRKIHQLKNGETVELESLDPKVKIEFRIVGE